MYVYILHLLRTKHHANGIKQASFARIEISASAGSRTRINCLEGNYASG